MLLAAAGKEEVRLDAGAHRKCEGVKEKRAPASLIKLIRDPLPASA